MYAVNAAFKTVLNWLTNKNAINTGSGDVCGASVVAVHGWGNTYIAYRNKNNPSGYSFDPNAKKDQIEIITCVKKGELLFTGPEIDHAMFYTEETEILVMSKNPRDQKTYEEDTVRIDFMSHKNRF